MPTGLPIYDLLASAAFGVVAALVWNSAITTLFKTVFGSGACAGGRTNEDE